MTEPGDNQLLPIDSDTDADQTTTGAARPVHLRVRFIALVAVGGTVGTAAREALSLAIPAVNGIPVAILGINVLGAFLLGLLLDALVRRGPDHGLRRNLRLLAGTGFLGGFTTYSALALDTAALVGNGAAGTAAFYAVATVLIGAGATWLGIATATAYHHRLSGRARS